MRPLTLFTLDGSVVSRFLETDISQVQNSGYDLKHHGSVLCGNAHHVHCMLGENKKGKVPINAGEHVVSFATAAVDSFPRCSHCVFADKHKQEEVCRENTEERQGKRGRRPNDNNEGGTAWFEKGVQGYIEFDWNLGLNRRFLCRIAAT